MTFELKGRKEVTLRIVVAAVLLALAAGCANDKPSDRDKTAAATSVGILFTVDGVTVYRFGDGDRYHYFAVRDGRPDTITLSSWTENCGKNCRRTVQEEIPVLASRR